MPRPFNLHDHLESVNPSNIFFSKNFNTNCPSPWTRPIRLCKNKDEKFKPPEQGARTSQTTDIGYDGRLMPKGERNLVTFA